MTNINEKIQKISRDLDKFFEDKKDMKDVVMKVYELCPQILYLTEYNRRNLQIEFHELIEDVNKVMAIIKSNIDFLVSFMHNNLCDECSSKLKSDIH